jgi:2-oxoglutarate ferredoxin oxidoreductase subunit alpha
MVEDVQLAIKGRCAIHFYGRMGGVVPLPDEILDVLKEVDADIASEGEA